VIFVADFAPSPLNANTGLAEIAWLTSAAKDRLAVELGGDGLDEMQAGRRCRLASLR